MFKVGDNIIVKKDSKIKYKGFFYGDEHQYEVIGYDFDGYTRTYKLKLKSKNSKIKSNGKNSIILNSIVDEHFELDKNHYRKLKINKICSKLVTK